MTPAERSLRARLAVHSSWARTADRSARTAPARRALEERFERQVDPEGTMAPEARQKAAASARKAYFSQLAVKSLEARRRKKAG